MDNMEEVLMELNTFVNSLSADSTISPVLEDYLLFIAKTGTTLFPWAKIKPLFKVKLERVIDDFSQSPDDFPEVPNVDRFSFDACKEKVFQQLECFTGIPFTVQRLCELLVAPRKHYKRTDKFMRALEKNMLVVSTVEPRMVKKLEESTTAVSTNVVNGDHTPVAPETVERLREPSDQTEEKEKSESKCPPDDSETSKEVTERAALIDTS